MIDYNTVRSAHSAGLAKFEAWRDEWEQLFFAPMLLDQKRKVILSTPPQILEQFAEQRPEEFKALMKDIGG